MAREKKNEMRLRILRERLDWMVENHQVKLQQRTFNFIQDSWHIRSSNLMVRGMVPGIDEVEFQHAAEEAKTNCPVSQAFKDNVDITVQTVLDS